MESAPEARKPEFEAVMLAMDAVDSLVHQENMKLEELGRDGYRDALKAKLREAYLLQGSEVSDDILEAAVTQAEQGLYVFKPTEHGFERTLAEAYVRRGVYARRAAAALAGVAVLAGVSFSAYHFAVVAPRERELARVEKLFNETLPKDLALAVKDARDAVHAAGKDSDLERVDVLEKRGLLAIKLRDEAQAQDTLAATKNMTSEMNRAASVKLLQKEADETVAGAASFAMDANARKVVEIKAATLRQIAAAGSGRDFSAARDEFASTLAFIGRTYSLRIVNRSGVYSAFWRFYKGDRSKRAYYAAVEAIDAAGKPAPVDVMNVETGRSELVTMWGVRVPEWKYNLIGADKKADGIVNDADAGTKPAGSLDFKWAFETVDNQMITRWETLK